MDSEAAVEAEVPGATESISETPDDDATPESPQTKQGGIGKKKRQWQKVNAAEYYAPLSYSAEKGQRKEKGGPKGKDRGEDSQGKGKGKQGYKGDRGKGGDRYQERGGDFQKQHQQEEEVMKPPPMMDNAPAPTTDGGDVSLNRQVGGKKKGGKGQGKGNKSGGKNIGQRQGKSGGAGGDRGGSTNQSAGGSLGNFGNIDLERSGGMGTKGAPEALGQGGKANRGLVAAVAPTLVDMPEVGADPGDGPRPPGPQRPPMPGLGKGIPPQVVAGMPMVSPYSPYAMQYPYGVAPYPFPGMPAMHALPYYVMPSPTPLNMAHPYMPSPMPPAAAALPGPQQPAPLPHTAERASLQTRVQSQIEYYLSTENLLKDVYLRSKMNEEGWVPVALLASFNRIKEMTPDPTIVLDAIATSSKVELDAQGTHLRVTGNWQKWVLAGQPPQPAPGSPGGPGAGFMRPLS